MKGITALKNAVFSIEAVSNFLDEQSKIGNFMSTCPIFAQQINFKALNCRKTNGKTIKQTINVLIEQFFNSYKNPPQTGETFPTFLFSKNRANYVISIFNISFLFLKIAIRLASQNSLQDTKLLNRTKFFAFLTSRLSNKTNKNIASGFHISL